MAQPHQFESFYEYLNKMDFQLWAKCMSFITWIHNQEKDSYSPSVMLGRENFTDEDFEEFSKIYLKWESEL
jgi:hypothetical protein